MMIVVKYFASLREKLGVDEENIAHVEGITVLGVQEILSERSPMWKESIMDADLLVSINQEVADVSVKLCSGDEIAFFPPVTGG